MSDRVGESGDGAGRSTLPFGALNVLVIHGIGDHEKEFTAVFEKAVMDRVRRGVNGLVARYGLAAPPLSDPLHYIPGYWGHVIEAVERALGRRTFGEPLDFLRRFGMRFMGDVVAYRGPDIYRAIHQSLAEALRTQLAPESGHLSIIAHSLGAVIASDFVYDHTLKIGRSLHDEFGVSLDNVFTLGSPLALFAMQSCGGEGPLDPEAILNRFNRPIRMETTTGMWLNLYGREDIIGYPIKALNPAYYEAVTADVLLEVGSLLTRWNPLSHGEYWTEEGVVDVIAEKLAIDFAALHLGLAGAQRQTAYEEYRDRLAVAHPAPHLPNPSFLPPVQ